MDELPFGRFYYIQFSASAQTAAVDFFEITGATNKLFLLHKVRITQSSEVLAYPDEMLQFRIKRAAGSYTSGSGGAAGTFNPVDSTFPAATITAEQLNTTAATANTGTLTTLVAESRSTADGFQWPSVTHDKIDRNTALRFRSGEACVIGLGAAPADSITYDGWVLVEEIDLV